MSQGRLPFDPSKIRGDEPPAERPARRERQRLAHVAEASRLTVGELADLIKTTLEQRIPSPLRVIGQVSNLSAANHWYFTLKDDDAVVSCVAWASTARRFPFTPEEGDEVVATGHVSHYPPNGRTQFYVSRIDPVGEGALRKRFEALCAELRDRGYFDAARKKPLPVFPRRIAVITSASGAAIHDVTSTAAQRCRAVGLVVVDVRVQGEGAHDEVARAIRWVDRHHRRLGVDAILVTRGGGSIEDLWSFNERAVADAAFGCTIPLVAAIGHESDTTVIELVADHRAATPTQAAMALVPSSDELEGQLRHLGDRLSLLVRRRVEHGRQRLESAARHEAFRDPVVLIRRERQRLADLARQLRLVARVRADQRPRLDALAARLAGATTRLVERARSRVAALGRELSALDPREVLRRGFSYTTNAQGELVRSTGDVSEGDAIRTHVADGAFDSVVGPERAAEMDLPGPGE